MASDLEEIMIDDIRRPRKAEAYTIVHLPADCEGKTNTSVQAKVDIRAGSNVMPLRVFERLYPKQMNLNVTQRIYVHKLHTSYGSIGPVRCVFNAFCIIFGWYFVRVFLFCLCFASCISFIKFSPSMGSVYWFHSSPLHMCPFGAVPVNLTSLIYQWIICHIWSVLYVVKCGECIVTYANHLTFGSI